MATKTRSMTITVLQGAAVLGGVLLALAADASWDYRVDRVQEREYLEAFQTDFAGNADRIDSVLVFHQRSDAELRRLISVIDSAGTARIPNDSIESLFRPKLPRTQLKVVTPRDGWISWPCSFGQPVGGHRGML